MGCDFFFLAHAKNEKNQDLRTQIAAYLYGISPPDNPQVKEIRPGAPRNWAMSWGQGHGMDSIRLRWGFHEFLDASYKLLEMKIVSFFGGFSTLGDSAEVHGNGTSSGNTQQLGCNPYCRGEPIRFECGQTIKNQDQREDSMNG